MWEYLQYKNFVYIYIYIYVCVVHMLVWIINCTRCTEHTSKYIIHGKKQEYMWITSYCILSTFTVATFSYILLGLVALHFFLPASYVSTYKVCYISVWK
jgi:hypothetical protein